MKRYSILILTAVLILTGCNFTILEDEPDIIPNAVEPVTGLNDYVPVSLKSVVDESRTLDVPGGIATMSDESLIMYMRSSIEEFLGEGFVYALFEGLGLNPDDIFNSGNLRPRGLSASSKVHFFDEGVLLRKDMRTLADATVHHLDVQASASSVDFLKFLFTTLDSMEWGYSPKDANMSGTAGFSLNADIKSVAEIPDIDVEKAAISAFADVELTSVTIDEIGYIKDGAPGKLYFPDNGHMKFSYGLSLASSVFTTRHYSSTDKDGNPVATNVEGYPILNDDGIIYKTWTVNHYCPWRVWLSIDESNTFSVVNVFNLLREILNSPDKIADEANWNRLASIIWPTGTGKHITLGVDIYDDGTGHSRTASISDFALLQFLL